MSRYCNAMPCAQCSELLFEAFVLVSIFGLATFAKVMPLIAH